MKKNDCVSVIVPMYNAEKYIENCINSILNQTYSNIEIIVVNDGSIDNSEGIVRKLMDTYGQKIKLIQQKNAGVSKARNTGILQAKGDWVVCVDADDSLSKQSVEMLLEKCCENKTNVGFMNFLYVKNDEEYNSNIEKVESRLYKSEELLKNFLTRKIKLIVPGMIIKKSELLNQNLFFDESVKYSEDQHFIWKILYSFEKYTYISTPLYVYIKRSNSIMTSSKNDKMITGYYAMQKLVIELQEKNKLGIEKFILPRWVLGTSHIAAKNVSKADFFEILNQMEYKKHMRDMVNFPEIKAKILSAILYVNKNLFYKLLK